VVRPSPRALLRACSGSSERRCETSAQRAHAGFKLMLGGYGYQSVKAQQRQARIGRQPAAAAPTRGGRRIDSTPKRRRTTCGGRGFGWSRPERSRWGVWFQRRAAYAAAAGAALD
jgi:hypothetical protein